MTTGKSDAQQRRNQQIVGDEAILKVSKEVAIKFIEMGRITPATFDETFKNIHATVSETVKKDK